MLFTRRTLGLCCIAASNLIDSKRSQAYIRDIKAGHLDLQVLIDMAVEEGGQHGIGARQLTAFVGGIDVTNGRYDTARHSLFRTLEFEHSDDMHQPCIPGADIKFGGGSLQTPQPHCSR